jgi:hypothetical protein
MEKIYFDRLWAFANYLLNFETNPFAGLYRDVIVYAYDIDTRIHLDVKTPYLIFEELPDCFPEDWAYDPCDGEPYWKKLGDKCNPAECVCDYFGISNYEVFCHLFDTEGHQSVEKYGGLKLNENAAGKEVAYNILEYIKSHAKNG